MLRRGPLKPVVLVHTDIHPMDHVKTLGKHAVLVGDGWRRRWCRRTILGDGATVAKGRRDGAAIADYN